MIVFTIVGLVWFWLFCFELGYRLGWAIDNYAALAVTIARSLLCTRQTEAASVAVMAHLAASAGLDLPDGGKHG